MHFPIRLPNVFQLLLSLLVSSTPWWAHADLPAPPPFAGLDDATVLMATEQGEHLTLWLVERRHGEIEPVLTTQDGQLLIEGPVTRSDGLRLDERAASAARGATILDAAHKLNQAYVGPRGAPQAYVFYDPMCGGCESAIEMLLAAGYGVRVVPIAVLGSDSQELGARLLASPSPLRLIRRYGAGEYPTVTGPSMLDESLLDAVRQNTHRLLERGAYDAMLVIVIAPDGLPLVLGAYPNLDHPALAAPN